MLEQWISQCAYMKKFHIGFSEMKHLIDTKQVECRKTEGGQYKIKIGGDTVSKEMYENERKKRIEAETKLNVLKNMFQSALEIN